MDDVTLDEELDAGTGELTGSMKANLKESFRWMRTVAVLTIVMTAVFMFMMLWVYSNSPRYVANDMVVGLVIMVIFGGFQVFLMITLNKAGNAYKSYLQTNSASDMEMAFAKQKQFWLIMGILSIIGAFFFVVGFLGFMSQVNRIGGPF